MKNVAIGIKNEPNYFRNSEMEISPKYIPLNNISFQDHLFILVSAGIINHNLI